jgi:hypothetical protein
MHDLIHEGNDNAKNIYDQMIKGILWEKWGYQNFPGFIYVHLYFICINLL